MNEYSRELYHLISFINQCTDSDQECGDDEVYTIWVATGDWVYWGGSTESYYSFDENDKPIQYYAPKDAQVVTDTGNYADIKHNLSVTLTLIETDPGDSAKKIIGIAGQVAGYIGGALSGPRMKAGIEAAAKGIQEIVQYVCGDEVIGNGPITLIWPSVSSEGVQGLQELLVGSNTSMEFKMDFWGDEKHGRYTGWGTIIRR